MLNRMALARHGDFFKEALPWLHQEATMDEACDFYEDLCGEEDCDNSALRLLCQHDRFFLFTHILNRPDGLHPWLYARCREVEAAPDGHIDLWAREHWKSSLITFAGLIQEILRNPEITIGLFSFTKPAAKAFLNQIRRELQNNNKLQALFPDIFWTDPAREAPTWSLDAGVVVKRQGNPKEQTIEAHGVVEGSPTGRHFGLLCFDDIVTRESCYTPEMIQKTTEAWELALHLGAAEEDRKPRVWYIGTRYNANDTYHTILKRDVAIPRIYAATDTGLPDGSPVLLSDEQWLEKRKSLSLYVLSCQMLQNPLAGSLRECDEDWIRYYEIRPETLQVAILVDPASSKKQHTSNTAMAVLGIDHASNKFLLDGACHKMDLNERWKLLRGLHKKWSTAPGIGYVKVGYERYGALSDVQHYRTMMQIEGYWFDIIEVSWTRDRTQAKDDRIRRLLPDFANSKFWLPYSGRQTSLQRETIERNAAHLLAKPIKRINEEEKVYDLTEWFLDNEYRFFPASTQKDFMDAMSRVYDLEMTPPRNFEEYDYDPPAENYF